MSGVGGIVFLTVGLGLSLLVGVVVTLIVLCCLSRRNKKRQGKSRQGMVSNPLLAAAIQQSFASQTQYVVSSTFDVDQGGGGENECLTCSLIQMGSSMAYGDNSCPQCGAQQNG